MTPVPIDADDALVAMLADAGTPVTPEVVRGWSKRRKAKEMLRAARAWREREGIGARRAREDKGREADV